MRLIYTPLYSQGKFQVRDRDGVAYGEVFNSFEEATVYLKKIDKTISGKNEYEFFVRGWAEKTGITEIRRLRRNNK